MRRRPVLGLLSAALMTSVLLAGAMPVMARSHARVLLEDLASPKGLSRGPAHTLVLGAGEYGPPGPLLLYHLRGSQRGSTTTALDVVSVADVAVLPDGTGWAIGTDLVLYHGDLEGNITAVLDIAGYQATDPDPYNPDGADPAETNPFGLAVLPNGDALVADAAGNDVLRVTLAGDVTTVARWTGEEIAPGVFAEAVPTSIAIGRDGWIYVGQLTGFPAIPGTSHIWRVNPDAHGAVCDVLTPDANCSVWMSGFTSIMDLDIHRPSGKVYVYEIAEDGWLAFEEGFGTGDFPPAVLLEVQGEKRTELVPGQLSQPGGVVVTSDGVYVTDGMFTGGRLVRVRGMN